MKNVTDLWFSTGIINIGKGASWCWNIKDKFTYKSWLAYQELWEYSRNWKKNHG